MTRMPPLKKFSASDLEQFVSAHGRFVARQTNGVRLICKFKDLRGVILQRRELSEADFSGCDLSDSRLAMSQFERASLYCANLENADLRGTNFRQADLRGIRVRGANLYGSVLDDADFRNAELARADLDRGYRLWASGSRSGGSGPNGAISDSDLIRGVDFRDCSLKRARLGGAKLEGADFSGANLEGADIRGARLTNAIFHGAILSGVDLKGVRLSDGALDGCILDPTPAALARSAELRVALRAAERWLTSKGAEGQVVSLASEDLRPLRDEMSGRRLPALGAAGLCGIDVDFSGSFLPGAVFTGADLRGAKFRGVDLRGANFRGCQLAHADFTDADLGPLMLGGDRAHMVDFAEATLTGANFNGAIGVPADVRSRTSPDHAAPLAA